MREAGEYERLDERVRREARSRQKVLNVSEDGERGGSVSLRQADRRPPKVDVAAPHVIGGDAVERGARRFWPAESKVASWVEQSLTAQTWKVTLPVSFASGSENVAVRSGLAVFT